MRAGPDDAPLRATSDDQHRLSGIQSEAIQPPLRRRQRSSTDRFQCWPAAGTLPVRTQRKAVPQQGASAESIVTAFGGADQFGTAGGGICAHDPRDSMRHLDRVRDGSFKGREHLDQRAERPRPLNCRSRDSRTIHGELPTPHADEADQPGNGPAHSPRPGWPRFPPGNVGAGRYRVSFCTYDVEYKHA